MEDEPVTSLRRVVLRDGRRWEVRSESLERAIERACDALGARREDVESVIDYRALTTTTFPRVVGGPFALYRGLP